MGRLRVVVPGVRARTAQGRWAGHARGITIRVGVFPAVSRRVE
ncbi:hypothetical protein GA0115244_108835 [Streptomyces sp. DvalAA-19]|nr:hypothetical protein GA0115244_108835 [Streptomyces sp. DvalAA-19]